MLLNNLLSDEVYPGQVINLPIPKPKHNKTISKNHVDITNALKQDGSKNTNKRHYLIGADAEASETGGISASAFVKGVSR